ncbi:MarR family transcriptional regulator [Rhodococcus sp. IEGM 1366]|uniref:MarR family transcriptional regulator n=1 Tax=Rhodococcus sp. IEGM 1366 TaxID=3082223 RepID=UPI002955AE8B|nr:MarR family transcriptional regulator [Rhodococcus sp. IEGM 1366]MDV8071362.1 MarR family transcriptional regulator [Rhodococcus sp. IEGM 1366]
MSGQSNSNTSAEIEDGAALPATAYAVLGVLSTLNEELSASEIKARCDYTLRLFYWSPAVSHIRRELRRLRELGLITEREVQIGQVRRTMVYQTTDRGEVVLRRWVSGLPVDEPVVLKNPALLRVYLGAATGPHDVVKILDNRLEQLQHQIDDLVWGRRRSEELHLADAEHLRYAQALSEYLLRSAHFEHGNVRQLRDRIADMDSDNPALAVTRPKGPVRRRSAVHRTVEPPNDPGDSSSSP